MARYRLLVKRSVVRDLRGIPKTDVRRLLTRIRDLADDPCPRGAVRLAGINKYRLRQGRYRILYTIEDDRLIVHVIKVAHRREAYRRSR